MATKKVPANKQPENDPQLQSEVHDAVQSAESDAKTGNVATAKSPDATVPAEPLAYQGHDRR